MKKILAVVLMASMVFMIGCMTHTHVVGEGGKTGTTDAARQWYILWGLVPLNHVDTKTMAAGATNYSIKTQFAPLDVLISMVTGIVTVNCRTVEVAK